MPTLNEKTEIDGLSPQKWIAVEALIAGSSISDTAAKVGISERTLHRWLNESRFQQSMRKHRRRAFDTHLSSLYAHVPEAINTLARLLTCGHTPTQAKAAMAILDKAIGTLSYTDLSTELDQLKQLVEEQGNSKLEGISKYIED